MGEVFEEGRILETSGSAGFRSLAETPHIKSLFTYFLDGSRKVYKLTDIQVNNKYLPIVCAQIGVCCAFRENKLLNCHKLDRRNLLLVPDSMNEIDYDEIRRALVSQTVRGITIQDVHKYEYSRKSERDPLNLALAKIIQEMQRSEIDLIIQMTESGRLRTDSMLIIDGALQFSDKRVNAENFRNVIGVSKSFNIHHTGILKKKTQEIGTILLALKYGERTPVYSIHHEDTTIGAWYIRIRERRRLRNAMEGIIKVEKIANDRENENISGFNSDEIDTISRCLLHERNVSCYGSDRRWANHLYPIYLTEKLIKSSFVSDLYYLNVF